MQLEHINLTVSDLDRSITFYRTLLGCEIRWRGETSSGHAAAHIGDDRHYLALFQADGKKNARQGIRDYESVGLNHFGFIVDDLDAARQCLTSLGVTPHAEQTYNPGRRLYFFDPDGIEVELVVYAPEA